MEPGLWVVAVLAALLAGLSFLLARVSYRLYAKFGKKRHAFFACGFVVCGVALTVGAIKTALGY